MLVCLFGRGPRRAHAWAKPVLASPARVHSNQILVCHRGYPSLTQNPRIALCCVGLRWVTLVCVALGCVGLCWVALHWVALDWVVLGCMRSVGLGWVALRCVALHRGVLDRVDNHRQHFIALGQHFFATRQHFFVHG